MPITSYPVNGSGGSGTATAIRTGLLAAIPATAAVGDVYYATDATIATGLSKFYVATAVNTWTQQGAQGNADGSVTITSSASGLIDIQVTAGVFASLAGANTWTGSNVRTSSTDKPPAVVFASLPSAATNSGDVYIVTDALTPAAAAGGGSYRVWVRSNGATYDVVSPGSAVAVQATTGRGGIFPHGTPQSGTFGADFAGGSAYGQEFTAAASVTVSTAIVYFGAIGASGRYMSLAIYDSTEAKIGEATPLLTTGLSSTATTMTFATPVNLLIGQVYYLGFGADAGSGSVSILEINSNYGVTMGNIPATKRFFTFGTISSAGASQTLPANVSTRVASTTLNPVHFRLNP